MTRLLIGLCASAMLAIPLLAAKPANLNLERRYNLTYATEGRTALQLDFVAPKTSGPHPCVVCLHGGAWKAGSRKDLSTPALWADFGIAGALPRAAGTRDITAPLRTKREPASLLDVLASQGFAAASVSYRLAPKNKFPTQIRDVKTAVRYLRAHAKELNIDPDRIAALGFSAGGHLASLLGTCSEVPEFEGELYAEQSSRVCGVVNFFGPADLTLYTQTPGIEQAFMVPLLGTASRDDLDVYKKASPIEHVSADDPPFLHIHGTVDLLVPMIHSERLHAKMKQAGVSSELMPMAGKGHGWFGPEAAVSTARAIQFLNAQFSRK